MAIEDLYNDEVDIEKVTRLVDGLGGWKEDWTVEIVGIKGHIWTLSGSEIDEYAKKQVIAHYGFMCPEQETEITEAMRLKWGLRTFDITHVITTMHKDKYMKLLLEERKLDV